MEQKTVSFTFSIETLNVILYALAKQPYETVADLITSLRTEAEKQLTPPEEVTEEE